MKEHFALSQAQKDYLSGQKTLSNEASERSRIRRKAFQAWSVFRPILDSTVVSNEWKYSLFGAVEPSKLEQDFDIPHDQFTFQDFLHSLLKTNSTNPASQEIERMNIAKMLINEGLLYYMIRFKTNHLVYQKITEYKEFLEMIQGLYEQEIVNIVKSDFIRLRKGMPVPPHIEPDQFYHAVCIQCYSYSLNQANNEQDTIPAISHTKDCPFVLEYEKADHFKKGILIADFIKFIAPRKNK